jgi:hypothetical protein
MATSSNSIIVTPELERLRLAAARMDELERLFAQLLAIVQSLVETQTEFTGWEEVAR